MFENVGPAWETSAQETFQGPGILRAWEVRTRERLCTDGKGPPAGAATEG